jgi:sphingomyelin phosphodiesterase
VSQYFGHTHNDAVELFYELDSNGVPLKRATSVAFIAPSVTTYQEKTALFHISNPAYNIYTLDGAYEGSSFNTLDFTTMYLDLKDANQRNITEWKVEYDTKTEYGLDSLLPRDFDNLINKMLSDLYSPLTEKYIK